MLILIKDTFKIIPKVILSLTVLFFVISCKEKPEEDEGLPLPVLTVEKQTARTLFPYLGTIEGIVNVEVRPQVEGILEEIYVDEGQFVEKLQPLFKINELPYIENLNNANANVALEKARVRKAKTELERLEPLIEHEVISPVRLENAKADYDVAIASLARAEAEAANMRINLEFTTINAPVSGYIGRIPKRIGNLVSKGDSEPLTILSDVHEVYVYFSMSESDFLFYERMRQDSTSKRISPDVKLILADDSTYEHTGVIDADVGQINRSTGSITLRAKFINPDALLRLGSTAKVILEQIYPDVILVPQESTLSVQDKVFVFTLDENNIVAKKEINIEGISGGSYIVNENNLRPGDRIVLSGIDRLGDGIKVKPFRKGSYLVN